MTLLFSAALRAESCHSLQALDWLLGDWEYLRNGKITRESWRRVSPGTFEGQAQTSLRNRKTPLSSETLRLLSMDNDIFYLAKVSENEYPVAFKLRKCSAKHWVFENSGHDFPKRMLYTLKRPDKLIVDVSGDDDSGFQLVYRRVTGQ